MKWAVDLDVKLPAGFTVAPPRSGDSRDGDLEPIDLSQTPQLALEAWGSARDAHGKTSIAWACVGTDVGTWNADVTELANQKLVEIASGTAARMHGSPIPMHVVGSAEGGTFFSDDEALGASARTFLVFTPNRAHGCFVACSSDCGTTIDDARIVGDLRDPPPAGWSLRTISYAVHHPRVAAGAACATILLLAALALLTRPGKSKKTKHSRA